MCMCVCARALVFVPERTSRGRRSPALDISIWRMLYHIKVCRRWEQVVKRHLKRERMNAMDDDSKEWSFATKLTKKKALAGATGSAGTSPKVQIPNSPAHAALNGTAGQERLGMRWEAKDTGSGDEEGSLEARFMRSVAAMHADLQQRISALAQAQALTHIQTTERIEALAARVDLISRDRPPDPRSPALSLPVPHQPLGRSNLSALSPKAAGPTALVSGAGAQPASLPRAAWLGGRGAGAGSETQDPESYWVSRDVRSYSGGVESEGQAWGQEGAAEGSASPDSVFGTESLEVELALGRAAALSPQTPLNRKPKPRPKLSRKAGRAPGLARGSSGDDSLYQATLPDPETSDIAEGSEAEMDGADGRGAEAAIMGDSAHKQLLSPLPVTQALPSPRLVAERGGVGVGVSAEWYSPAKGATMDADEMEMVRRRRELTEAASLAQREAGVTVGVTAGETEERAEGPNRLSWVSTTPRVISESPPRNASLPPLQGTTPLGGATRQLARKYSDTSPSPREQDPAAVPVSVPLERQVARRQLLGKVLEAQATATSLLQSTTSRLDKATPGKPRVLAAQTHGVAAAAQGGGVQGWSVHLEAGDPGGERDSADVLVDRPPLNPPPLGRPRDSGGVGAAGRVSDMAHVGSA